MRTKLIAVVGTGTPLAPDAAALAEELGAALVRADYGVVCGGLGGVMEAVCRGAVRERGKGQWPPILGILPGYDHDGGNDYLDVAIPTGLGHARNAVIAAAGDAMVCLGGAMGALSEVALARKIGRPVIAMPAAGGTARLAAKAIPTVVAVATVAEAIARLRELLR
jgi:uncharacterized protein (TIGR00725 family)